MMRTSRVAASGPLPAPAPRRAVAAAPPRAAGLVARSYWDSYYATGGSAPSNNGNGNTYLDSNGNGYDDAHSGQQHINGSGTAYFGSGSYDQEEDIEYASDDDEVYAHEATSYPQAPAASYSNDAGPGKEDVQQAIASNPLFNSRFMGVLQDSLARQGAEALTSAPPVEERVCATEEVLTTALGQSKHTLQQMMAWKEQLDRQILAQQKQVDRMEFALNKSRGDAAYMRALKNMMSDQ